ncbi:ABC transporter ATP-binding protein [Pseudoruegeria sp. HB172150]|uniref:ABC transporter ATP-binding protein n=1 Tax=Pseudoruegeria sp. HB172150 TaxID=2721164 RepID=UPI001C131E45|nr:ABC transporter ATP-binding protein [Pseudoruegeria sp. HB172150]
MSAMAAPAEAAASNRILEIRDLNLSLRDDHGWVQVLNDVSFSVRPNEILGMVGESGSGKSMTALSILRLHAKRDAQLSGQIQFDGHNLATASEGRMRRIRGRHVSMIFQEPMSALDPVFTVGEQIAETVRRHFGVSRKEAFERAVAALDSVGIASPRTCAGLYPMALSGGMRQRVMIAMALVCEPKLLLADEPTTALDVTIQAQIMDLLLELAQKTGTSVLLITHDLGLVAETCDRVITMYAGQIVEEGRVRDVISNPQHPYTAGLMRSIPDAHRPRGGLSSIAGRVPSFRNMPEGCRFRPRCEFVEAACSQTQRLTETGGHLVRCHRARQLSLEGAPA